MTIASDMATMQAQIAANEKAQLLTVQTALNTLVASTQAALDNLPRPVGPQSTVYNYVGKVIGNTNGLVQEIQYLLQLYPVDVPPSTS